MPAPKNTLKAALNAGDRSIGLWLTLCDGYSAEVAARAGFDWLVIDGEHAPNDLRSILRQLQVIEPFCPAIVRLPVAAPWMIKQVLDAGAQSLILPMINSAEEARAAVRATRYPPQGIRGVGHALGRASGFGAEADYAENANDEICVIVQIESRAALDALDEILAVDGVDAGFVGPADLAADMGYVRDVNAPEMQALVAQTLGRIRDSGKPAGIIDLPDQAIAAHFDSGAQFVAVGIDSTLLSAMLRRLSGKWKSHLGQVAALTRS